MRSAYFGLTCCLLSVALHLWVLGTNLAQERVQPPAKPRRPGAVQLLPTATPSPTPPSTSVASPAAAAAQSEPAAAAEAAPAEPAPAAPAGLAGDGDYVPRPLLTVAPQPQQTVMLTWPDFEGQQAQYQGVLALYIDEQGVVQRIRMVEGDLPPELEAQARAAFLGIRFAPGEVDGVAVRSRIQVEVVFERPEPPASVSRGVRR